MLEAALRRPFAIPFRHISWRFPGLLTTLLALVLSPVPFASAIDAPKSAYSTSLGMDPMLLVDHEVLSFLQPSMALLHSPQAVAIVEGYESDLIGVLVGRGDTRVLVSSRERYGESLRPFFDARIVQAGLARKIGSTRLACSAHFDTDPDETFSSTTGLSPDYEKRESGIIAGQASLGFGSGSRRLDVSMILHHLRDANKEKRSSLPSEINLERIASPIQLTAISRMPTSSGGSMVLALDWMGGNSEAKALLDGIERHAESYSRVWRIHGAWQSLNLSPSTICTVHSSWENTEHPVMSLSVDRREVSRRTTRTLQLGLGIQHRVSSYFNAIGGISTSHVNSRRDSRESDWNGAATRRTVIRDGYAFDRFSWGLQFERGRAQLVGGLSTTLDLDNLIGRIDVHVNL